MSLIVLVGLEGVLQVSDGLCDELAVVGCRIMVI